MIGHGRVIGGSLEVGDKKLPLQLLRVDMDE